MGLTIQRKPSHSIDIIFPLSSLAAADRVAMSKKAFRCSLKMYLSISICVAMHSAELVTLAWQDVIGRISFDIYTCAMLPSVI